MPLWNGCSESIDVTLWDFALFSKENKTQSSLFLHSIRKKEKGSATSKITNTEPLLQILVDELSTLFVQGLVQDWPVAAPNIISTRTVHNPLRVMVANILGDCASLFENLFMRGPHCFACDEAPYVYNVEARSFYYNDFASYGDTPESFLLTLCNVDEKRKKAENVKHTSPELKKHAQKLWRCNGYTPYWDLVSLYSVDEGYSSFNLVTDTLFDLMHLFFCRDFRHHLSSANGLQQRITRKPN